MALQRPLKEGNVRTYQEKVALNFKDILASEADGDHDTMYAAWNGALGGDLTGTLPNPTVVAAAKSKWSDSGATLTPASAGRTVTAPAGVVFGAGTITGQVRAFNDGTVLFTSNDYAAPQDATKSSWQATMSPIADNWTVQRRTPNAAAGTGTVLLNLDNAGNLSAGGTNDWRLAGGSGPAKSRMLHMGAFDRCDHSYNVNWTGSAWARDDTAKPAGALSVNVGSSNRFQFDYWNAAGTLSTPFYIATNSSPVGDLLITGNNATKATGSSWINPSDPRLKDDIAPYAAGLAEICQLAPITYRLKSAPDRECYGFDASKVRDIFPECVSTTRMKLDPADEEETDDVLVFDMHPILVALVNAVRELAAKVAP